MKEVIADGVWRYNPKDLREMIDEIMEILKERIAGKFKYPLEIEYDARAPAPYFLLSEVRRIKFWIFSFVKMRELFSFDFDFYHDGKGKRILFCAVHEPSILPDVREVIMGYEPKKETLKVPVNID